MSCCASVSVAGGALVEGAGGKLEGGAGGERAPGGAGGELAQGGAGGELAQGGQGGELAQGGQGGACTPLGVPCVPSEAVPCCDGLSVCCEGAQPDLGVCMPGCP